MVALHLLPAAGLGPAVELLAQLVFCGVMIFVRHPGSTCCVPRFYIGGARRHEQAAQAISRHCIGDDSLDFEIEAETSLGFALKRQKIAGHKPFLHRIEGETESFQCGSAQNGLFGPARQTPRE